MELDKLDNGAQDASKWCPIWYKMKPKVVSASLIGGYVYLSFFVKAVYILLVSFTFSHFHKSSPILLQVLQPFGWRYVECAIHQERDVHEEQHPYMCDTNKQQ